MKYQVCNISILYLIVVDCGALNNSVNGSIHYTTGTTFGQRVNYSCNTGYNLMGDSTRICQATGVWSGSAPTCQGMLLLPNMCVFAYVVEANIWLCPMLEYIEF